MKAATAERSLRITFVAGPRAHRGKLRTGTCLGVPIHATSFLKKRHIVLDEALLSSPAELARIVTHELFHFAWARLGNPARRELEALIAAECRARVPGELGWSAELRKQSLTARDCTARTRRWREYVCESFCDTAAWLYSAGGRHPEFTLPAAQRRRRKAWFARLVYPRA